MNYCFSNINVPALRKFLSAPATADSGRAASSSSLFRGRRRSAGWSRSRDSHTSNRSPPPPSVATVGPGGGGGQHLCVCPPRGPRARPAPLMCARDRGPHSSSVFGTEAPSDRVAFTAITAQPRATEPARWWSEPDRRPPSLRVLTRTRTPRTVSREPRSPSSTGRFARNGFRIFPPVFVSRPIYDECRHYFASVHPFSVSVCVTDPFRR